MIKRKINYPLEYKSDYDKKSDVGIVFCPRTEDVQEFIKKQERHEKRKLERFQALELLIENAVSLEIDKQTIKGIAKRDEDFSFEFEIEVQINYQFRLEICASVGDYLYYDNIEGREDIKEFWLMAERKRGEINKETAREFWTNFNRIKGS